jgi:hypothetical protein
MERDWLIPFGLLAVFEWACAQALAWSVGYPGAPDYISQFAFMAIIGFGALFCFYAFHFFKMMFRAAPEPTRALLQLTRDNLPRFATIGLGLAFTALHMVAFNWSKSVLPVAVPFWADVALADFDEVIFGMAAWEWAYRLAGNASGLFYWTYALWAPLQVAVLLALIFSRQSSRRSCLLVAYLLTWIIGGALSFAVSSAGPLFYGPLGFGDRFNSLISQPHLQRFPETAYYLWQNYVNLSALPAAGISAFPSLHVAIAVWVALALRHWLGWIYPAIITFGSILFGWHYILDAPAGMIVAILAYYLAQKILGRGESRSSVDVDFAEAEGARTV